MKVFQIASPTMEEWGLERLQGLGLSTSALMPGVQRGSQSHESPSPHTPVPSAAATVSQLDPQTPLHPQSSPTSGTIPLALSSLSLSLTEYISRFVHLPPLLVLLSPQASLLSPQAARPSFDFPINPGYRAWK